MYDEISEGALDWMTINNDGLEGAITGAQETSVEAKDAGRDITDQASELGQSSHWSLAKSRAEHAWAPCCLVILCPPVTLPFLSFSSPFRPFFINQSR